MSGDDPGHDDDGSRCAACLIRPARPGSPYCSALCRILHALRLAPAARPGSYWAVMP